ncbi:uncharacterized protein LOC120814275 isoform X2 [Gasterosteus aculeatus]
MDQGDALDFQALRAKFEAEELFLKRPDSKPALREKPRTVPPPQSPPHFLPVGARPSLLTSIGQSLEGRSAAAPRVIFKEDKKESKKPLIQIKGKDKLRGGKEKPDEGPMEQKNRREETPPEESASVPPPPPPAPAPKKKALLGFIKKRNSTQVPAESILDAPPSDGPEPAKAPLIPPPLPPAPVIPPPLIPAPAIPASDVPPPLIPAPVIPPPVIPAPVIPPPVIPAPVIPPRLLLDPVIPASDIPPRLLLDPVIPASDIPPPLIPGPDIPPPLIPGPDIPPPLIPGPVIPPRLFLDPVISASDIPPPLIPAPVILPPLIPAPVIPPRLLLDPVIPASDVPPPLIPASDIPPPVIPAPVIPPPLIPAPVILPPLIPAPVIPPRLLLDPVIPASDVPPPLIPASDIPPPVIPAPVIPPPLIPAPVIPPPLIPAPVILPPLIPAPVIPPRLLLDPVIPASDIPPPLIPGPDTPPPLIPGPVIPPRLFLDPVIPASHIPPPLILAPPEAPKALPPAPPYVPGPDAAVEGIPDSLVFSRQDDVIGDPTPPSDGPPIPPPGRLVSTPPRMDELPAVEAPVEVENLAEVEAPPSPPAAPTPVAASTGPASPPPSPKSKRTTSALAVLAKMEDLSPGRKTSACDQRIFSALEKARKKPCSPTNPSPSYPIIAPPEELPPSATRSLPELPPVDYEGNAPPPKPVNGFDPRQLPPVMERIPEEAADPIQELLLVPPPVPLKRILDPESLGPASEPSRSHPLKLSPLTPLPPFPLGDNRVPASQYSETDYVASDARSHSEGGGEHTGLQIPDGQNLPELCNYGTGAGAFTDPENPDPESSPPAAGLKDQVDKSIYESTENMYEAMPVSKGQKKGKGDAGRKRKGTPKNPYAEPQQETNGAKSKTIRFGKSEKKAAAGGSDEKEQRKKEKQRLEKEKKELKEKQEREKKELKEREKKENEIKKTFKIKGQEDAMYQARVTVTNKGRKNDLPVTCGEVVSIIRTTNCPKGKWLARSSSNNFGYIAVDFVELDIKEMMELGKKATRMSGGTNNSLMEDEVTRASNLYSMSAETFSYDSDEWSGDEEEPLSPALEPEALLTSNGHTRTLSMPDMGNKELSVSHAHSCSDIIADGPNVQARHEALQKLATFFHSPKLEEAATRPEVSSTQEMDFVSDMIILPPPDLYADLSVE